MPGAGIGEINAVEKDHGLVESCLLYTSLAAEAVRLEAEVLQIVESKIG